MTIYYSSDVGADEQKPIDDASHLLEIVSDNAGKKMYASAYPTIPVDPAGGYHYQGSTKPCESLSQDRAYCSVTRS